CSVRFVRNARHGSFSTEYAHCVSLVFSLIALTAWKMLHQPKIRCCHAAEKPAIHAECSRDKSSNSQTADKTDIWESSSGVQLTSAPLSQIVSLTDVFLRYLSKKQI
ncbi:hypothetical protein, partial [Planktotalea frisia]|uniref:hypothetical protein n=1 Tax=Planktotalea frisia TaxID=696762 RepID=UPI001C31928E